MSNWIGHVVNSLVKVHGSVGFSKVSLGLVASGWLWCKGFGWWGGVLGLLG